MFTPLPIGFELYAQRPSGRRLTGIRYVGNGLFTTPRHAEPIHGHRLLNSYDKHYADRTVYPAEKYPLQILFAAAGRDKDIRLDKLFDVKLIGRIAGSEPSTMTQQHPFEAFYESIMSEPRPKMPKPLEDAERAELQTATDRPVTVKALCGELQATLVADGTFTLDYNNELHVDLNSFELLWYVKQKAFQQKAQGTVRLLQPMIACDPTFALRHIFLESGLSLQAYIEYEYKDMPGLVPAEDDKDKDMPGLVPAEDDCKGMPTPIRAILDRLQAKRAALENELQLLKGALQLQEENRALEGYIRELRSKLE